VAAGVRWSEKRSISLSSPSWMRALPLGRGWACLVEAMSLRRAGQAPRALAKCGLGHYPLAGSRAPTFQKVGRGSCTGMADRGSDAHLSGSIQCNRACYDTLRPATPHETTTSVCRCLALIIIQFVSYQ